MRIAVDIDPLLLEDEGIAAYLHVGAFTRPDSISVTVSRSELWLPKANTGISLYQMAS